MSSREESSIPAPEKASPMADTGSGPMRSLSLPAGGKAGTAPRSAGPQRPGFQRGEEAQLLEIQHEIVQQAVDGAEVHQRGEQSEDQGGMRGDEAHVHHRPGHAEFHQNEQNKDGKPGGKEPAREVVAPHAACPYGQQHKARPHHGNARQIESGRHGNLPHPDGTEHGDPCQNAQGKQHDEKPAPAQRRGDARRPPAAPRAMPT